MKDHITPIAVVAVLLLLCGYVGSYLTLIVRSNNPTVVELHTMNFHAAEYRVGGRAAEIFYWPANQIDRRVRSRLWRIDYSEMVQ